MADDIEYHVLTEADMSAAREAIDELFLKHEPMTVQFAMTRKQRDTFTNRVLPRALTSGLTIVAIDKVTRDLVGIRLSLLDKKGEPADDFEFDARDPNERSMCILFDVLHRASNNVDVFEEYGVDKVMHYMGVAVHPQYYGRGIGKKMMEKSIELALQQGIHIAVVEATSLYSRRIFDKMGFRLLSKINYADYAWEDELGKVTLGNLEPHEFASFYVHKF